MVMEYTIGWLVFFLALVIVGIIVGRKFGVLANIDVDQVASEKARQLKQQILADRLRRRFGKLRLLIIMIVKPFSKFLRNSFDALYNQLNAVQRTQVNREVSLNQEIDKRVEMLLAEARELVTADRLEAAEKKYIEVIGLEPRNFMAFHELGEVYFKKESFNEARQTLEHALDLWKKLKEETPGLKNMALGQAYYLLALVYESTGDLVKAIIELKKALKVEKNNPRYLDRLVEVSIMKKDKIAALDALGKLEAANPENQKLEQFKERIAEL